MAVSWVVVPLSAALIHRFWLSCRAPLRLPAAWRHPVVRPDSDRQLLAHPPVSAEPAGAVSGCRYGPMRENPGLQRPFRSRRPCRAVTCAPCTPDGV
ncbi:hypothetical protein [Escherichia coli]|uniref:hypothetical protein n=1 Tax=Escherichia coli TaxID=562 RepID=UPI0035CCE676